MNAGDLYFATPAYEGHVITARKAADPGDADVVIERNGEVVRHFVYPAYKVRNLAAHYTEVIDGEIAAGTDLLGGCVMPRDVAKETP